MGQQQNKGYAADDIDKCISILTHLVDNSDDFAVLSKEQQIELMKSAGQLSRLKEELHDFQSPFYILKN